MRDVAISGTPIRKGSVPSAIAFSTVGGGGTLSPDVGATALRVAGNYTQAAGGLLQVAIAGAAVGERSHFQVDGARCYPQPLQGTTTPGSKHNGIPMWIAGGGEKFGHALRDFRTYVPPGAALRKGFALTRHTALIGSQVVLAAVDDL